MRLIEVLTDGGNKVRISHVTVDLDVYDLNELLKEFLPQGNLRVLDISGGIVRGDVKLLWWNVDFTAKPSSNAPTDLMLEISASKIVPIPAPIVQRQLKEAIREAPPGVDVFRQSLRVHVPALLAPFGYGLSIREFTVSDGYIRLAVDNLRVPNLSGLFAKPNQTSSEGPRAQAGDKPFDSTSDANGIESIRVR